MATRYRIYGNGGVAGDPIDYATPIADLAAGVLEWETPALAPGSSWLFGVRAYDDVSGFEEANTDARDAVEVHPTTGADLSGRPRAVPHATARATAGGAAEVAWHYPYRARDRVPAGFKVWATAGTSVGWTGTPAATVPFDRGAGSSRATLSGLADGVAYAVGVRAYNAAGDDGGTLAVASVVGSSAGPGAVEGAAVVATHVD